MSGRNTVENTSLAMLASILIGVCTPVSHAEVDGWLRWRGPLQSGYSFETNLPDAIDVADARWTFDRRGRGAPVMADGHVYSVAYEGEEADLQEALVCLDENTGKIIWECRGLSRNIVASPVAKDGMAYLGSSYVKRRMFAVRLKGAEGDITATDNVVWRRQRRTPYVPSPLLYGDWLYFLNHYQGFLSRVHAVSGEEPNKPMRLPGMSEIYSSPVGAAGRVYITDRSGTTIVLSHDEQAPKMLARNVLEDSFNASAAIVGDELYLRGRRYLYCIAKPAAQAGGR